MNRRLAATVSLLLVGILLLAAIPGLVGCGDNGGGGDQVEIIIGYEGDWTGPAAPGAAEYGGGFLDYIKWTNEENPVPGVKLTVKIYDTRSDYSRTPIGYAWLKGQGMKVLAAPSPADIDINYSKLEQDQIPAFGTTSWLTRRNADWAFWVFDTMEGQTEFLMHWIATRDWDYATEGRNPKVALVGWSGLSVTVGSLAGAESYMAAHPGKFDWKGAHMSPIGNVNWSTEVSKLVGCDYIIIGTIGAGSATFIKESRNRDFTGGILSNSAPVTGWWNLITGSVDADLLYGQYSSQQMPWFSDNAFTQFCLTIALKYRSQEWVDTAFKQSSYCTGPAWGMMVVGAIRKAAEEVGPENVDSHAIRTAAGSLDLDMTADGWGIPWKLGPDNHVACDTTEMIISWDVQAQKWIVVAEYEAYP